ncbi:MAG: hypothetical protein UX85_C0001G0267 [Candidatus Beckwithbacteria bacterium GW2011_GWB1_47_15]|uniref:Uncharacterized protein n=1 Tax=Candidatus Beckwithbacteria bacterium GW2011_GWB1_47_15 TaxID=1618371 RepID=A0A0G1U778_9BACT|nr:MAG: hypothetical protein UY43_C0001G0858 [Candidatus Beckwithbacteria bacterium GW2011_GWC1_49_16]AQS30905.1 hypothetical protein [uncultured bacterium]KKU36089.1 MAG: hypothetical protein UX50_C0001G0266 [Candidatus Beckwithbacteria bacterium GW2011_GWA1_46_30]KKU62053.1 MAG: hypothetical protein UX85_C0001G0267 [Candidatus Beckwithbacteria bacterium GW2011_GWB1_47_15]KKU72394.1 MAG: hypothetical protein UX97_C0001G0264 [Candidatus Beckwithbacteria bacterium GW2011_GWA2_47_25]OGD49301.1 M
MADVKPLNLDTDAATEMPEAKKAKPIMPGQKLAVKKVGGVVLGLVLLGVASGYGLSRVTSETGGIGGAGLKRTVEESEITQGTMVGVKDEKAFRDTAEGALVAGGIDGEGSHHLEREGGESQNVYLTSSIIDLDQFVGRKVKVWGETFDARKAGWLMDVGRLEVLE